MTVERRQPVTDALRGDDAFQERVIETRETEEVPVVRKKAHVGEEVVIRREATERTETVRDTVRHEEAEVTPEKTHDPRLTPHAEFEPRRATGRGSCLPYRD